MAILQETPDATKQFDGLLPLHLQALAAPRLAAALARLPTTTVSGQFADAQGNPAVHTCVAFNYAGRLITGPVVVPYASGWPEGTNLFLVSGMAVGNPTLANPGAATVQYVGSQISLTEMLLEIKVPYGRLF